MEADKIVLLQNKMISYFKNDPKRINHLLKVHSFGSLIGKMENVSQKNLLIIQVAALVHDIGIKVAEEKYGSCNGKQQEIEGPPIARDILLDLCFNQEVIDRVAFLVGNHHSYSKIDGLDFQILVEADFLVNFYEDEMSENTIRESIRRIFKTSAGKHLGETMFG